MNIESDRCRLTLGPLLFSWPADRWSNFYARIADETPVDRVCLGEVVCSKRLPFYADRLPAAIERLQRGGKTVVLSSLALVTLPRERQLSAELARDAELEVEVNDLTLLAYLEPGRRFAVGPLVNVYNEGTLAFLAGRSARQVCLPPELTLDSVAALAAAAAPLGVAVEVWGFGRVPLALSGRCYHARIHSLAKDSCQFVCGEDTDGLAVDTLDGQRFLAVNGVQTLSSTYASVLPNIEELRVGGVGSLRLSPHSCDMVAVAGLFRRALDGMLSATEAVAELTALLPSAVFSNGFLRGPCGAAFLGARA